MINQYPYTDAHELNLDWILKTIKELLEEWASTKQEWTDVKQEWEDTKEAWQELRDFVTNYFDNLDVQEEINNKIDAMVDSGEFADLIAPFVTDQLPDVVANQIAAVVADQISAVVAGQIGDVVAEQIDGVVAEQIDDVVEDQIDDVVANQIGGAVAGQIDDAVEDQIGDVVATQLPPLVTQETATQVTSWLNQHVDPATGYVIDDTLTIQGAAADAKAVGDRFKSGYYPGITVGLADNLNSATYEEDSTPYLFRTTGGSLDVGNREYDEIVGGTIAWNQLVQNGNFVGTTGWTPALSATISASNNVLSMTVGTAAASGCGTNTKYVNGHKYFKTATIKSSIQIQCDVDGAFKDKTTGSGNWETVSSIFNWTYNTDTYRLYVRRSASGASTESVEVKNVMLVDVTKLLGVTIANYLYSLESGTPGAGVAKLKSWGFLREAYYSYNEGELLNVHPSKHIMTGFQQWDEEWEVGKIDWDGTNATDSTKIRCKNFIPVVPNTVYYVTAPYGIEIFYYDGSQDLISFEPFSKNNTDFTTPTDCHYVKFFVYYSEYGTTYNHDICINVRWDGERDGQYEEYRKYEYALDFTAGSSAEVSIGWRGLPKLDANNELYYDGDVYKHDGSNVRSWAYTDLGSLTWDKVNDHFVSQAVNISAPESDDVIGDLICAKYVTMSANVVSQDGTDKTIAVNTSRQLIAYDSTYASATAADFKTAMDGNVIVLKISFSGPGADVDPFDYPQICDDWGTEWYVDGNLGTPREVAVPVGHNTKYMANLKAKLEMEPDSPNVDGDYLMRRSGGTNSYVPYVKELPATPASDGTYKLQCTVTGGSASLSWVSNQI